MANSEPVNHLSITDKPPGFQSKIIYTIIGWLKMNRKMEKLVRENRYPKRAADIPGSLYKKYGILTENHNGRKVWEITPGNSGSDWVIIYLHGGAYYANLTVLHWKLIEQLVRVTRATVIVPDYPLAPEAVCSEVYQFMGELYHQIIKRFPEKRIALIGDSAGGGIALGFAQSIKKETVKQPEEIILFSPWLDVTMSDPDITAFEKADKILNVNGLKHAGKSYAGSLEVNDYRVSPVYGDFTGLPGITIFTGTKDMLITDARRCKQKLEEKGYKVNYFEFRGMFHDWVIITSLKESQEVIEIVRRILEK